MVRAGLLAVLIHAGCANTIVPARTLHDPTSIYVVDHGRHASLILPSRTGRLVRYAYGDWRWYALSNEGFIQGLAALFWPTPGTLGRADIGRPPTMDALRARLVEGADEILVVPVARERVVRLGQRLDGEYERHLATRVYNPLYGLHFVRVAEEYSLAHDSNDVTADWLNELGCEVRGPVLGSRWRLEAR